MYKHIAISKEYLADPRIAQVKKSFHYAHFDTENNIIFYFDFVLEATDLETSDLLYSNIQSSIQRLIYNLKDIIRNGDQIKIVIRLKDNPSTKRNKSKL